MAHLAVALIAISLFVLDFCAQLWLPAKEAENWSFASSVAFCGVILWFTVYILSNRED